MKRTFKYVLVAIVLIFGLQSYLFPQEKLKIAIVPKNKIGAFWQAGTCRCKIRIRCIRKC